MNVSQLIVGINGSLRAASSNAALLRAVARVLPDSVGFEIYDGMATLPHFNPDLDAEGMEPPPPVRALRELLARAGAIVISSPEYAHGVPGALKNLLDWLVSDGALVDKPVALLNAAPAGGGYAQAALAETLRTMNWRLVDEASRMEPFVRRKIAGALTDDDALAVLRDAMDALVRAAT